jgi:cysteine-rich repeat protein
MSSFRVACVVAVALLLVGVQSASGKSLDGAAVRDLSQDDKLPLIGEAMSDGADATSAVEDDEKTLGESMSTGAKSETATLLKSESKDTAMTFVAASVAATGTCGDGKREGNEECDDGNTNSNDGCSATCKVEGGYQCLPLEVNGKDLCVACGDKQCTTFFSRQSRCLNTGGLNVLAGKPARTGAKNEKKPSFMMSDEFLQEEAGLQGAFSRSATGFCECGANWCKQDDGQGSFTCNDLRKGWARKSLNDTSCTCAAGFCRMPLAGTVPVQYHCTPVHENMIRNNSTGICECRGAVAGVSSVDPAKAIKPQTAACQILPTKPVLKVVGGQDKFGQFQCVGAPYVKDGASAKCKACAPTGCKMNRQIGTGQFLCMTVTNDTSATKSSPYKKLPNGECECGKDQCLKPNGDHFVCRDLTNAKPYGPTKQTDGKCGCSADPNVCRLAIKGGFRCVHIAQDNFARLYRRHPNGNCACKFGMCNDPKPNPDNGALVCHSASPDSAYMRKDRNSLECACKPGACKFPNGVCKKCPVIPGHCESHCSNTTATNVQCVKFCRTKTIERKKARATAQGQMQSVVKTTAREVGCFIQKTVNCEITATSKKCTQKKIAKALYDCPAALANTPARLNDGTETFGYASVCPRKDLECQILKCGRNPNSAKCQQQAMLV